MKTICKASVLLGLALAAGAHAQNLAIDWWTFAGGAGTSTAGAYAITGATGQPDPGRLRSEAYTVEGGFWCVAGSFQQPEAPRLSVRLTGTNTIIISWSTNSPGFELQENAEYPDAPNWLPVNLLPAVVVIGENQVEKQVLASTPTGRRFYRLKKP
jgi:hypothetical protein